MASKRNRKNKKSSSEEKTSEGSDAINHPNSPDASAAEKAPSPQASDSPKQAAESSAGARTSRASSLITNSLSRGVADAFSLFLLVASIALIGFVSYRVMRPFILPLFLATVLAVIFQPFHRWLLRTVGNRRKIAAALTTVTILLVALMPFGWMIIAGVNEGSQWFSRLRDSDTNIGENVVKRYRYTVEVLGLNMPPELERGSTGDKITVEIAALSDNIDQTHSQQILAILQDVNTLRAELETRAKADEQTASSLVPLVPSKSPAQMALAAVDQLVVPREAVVTDGIVVSAARSAPLTELKTLIESIEQSDNPPTVEQKAEYSALVQQTENRFARVRQTLMGGVIKASVIDLLNPSETQKKNWQHAATERLREWTLKVTGQTTSLMTGFVLQTVILTISIYYFLLDGAQMISSAMKLSPMDDRHEAEMIAEFAKLSRGVVIATLLSAAAQGLLAGIGYFAVWGLDSLFMLTMLTMILAMVPFVGAAAVWVPVALYIAFIENRIPAAIGLAIYGGCVVSMADNVIKPLVLQGQSDLHPLFALLSVLGGVGALGPIGVLVGPMVVAFLQALLKILHNEIQHMQQPETIEA